MSKSVDVGNDLDPVLKLDEVYRTIMDRLLLALPRVVAETWIQIVDFFCAFAEESLERAQELFAKLTFDLQMLICRESGKLGVTFNFCTRS